MFQMTCNPRKIRPLQRQIRIGPISVSLFFSYFFRSIVQTLSWSGRLWQWYFSYDTTVCLAECVLSNFSHLTNNCFIFTRIMESALDKPAFEGFFAVSAWFLYRESTRGKAVGRCWCLLRSMHWKRGGVTSHAGLECSGRKFDEWFISVFGTLLRRFDILFRHSGILLAWLCHFVLAP